jgi:hypothetical protein
MTTTAKEIGLGSESNREQNMKPAETVGQPEFITVVSGLPRSGTSMMMRMLEAGGIPSLTDDVRKADHDNPGGYYEFEPVKQLERDNSWLAAARDKAVKVIYLLLYNLPRNHRYKVIFMRREVEEVIASQKEMLRRRGQAGSDLSDAQLSSAFRHGVEKLEAWAEAQENFELLHVNYNDVLYDSLNTVARIERFLERGLDIDAMIRVIDVSLHRQRCS